jgi:hypothetical protein
MLCPVISYNKPLRDAEAKWRVTEEEYPLSSYPPYCAGWAYVANKKAVQVLLQEADKERK